MDILIKNGTIVNADKSERTNILISNDKIIKISRKIKDQEGFTIIDAKGKYVIPGGIDPHVHMHLPNPTGHSSDDFKSGSKAAIYGGTTTIIDFVTPNRGQSLQEAITARKMEAKESITNYSFHISPVEWRNSTEGEIKKCIDDGFSSFKVYMAYKNVVGLEDDELTKVMHVVAKNGGIVTVHCEDGDKIEELRRQLVAEGKTRPEFHPQSRPAQMESDAVKKVIGIAYQTDCPLYIVHVSSELSIEHIKKAQENGQKIFAETCPHYLLLDDSKYIGDFDKTAPFILSPPIRKRSDQTVLWKALQDNSVQTTGTDHCPFMLSQKKAGINDFRKIPNGAGSVEHRLELLYTYGVLDNKIDINKWVDICSTQAAKIFGLYPKKGKISEGSDADIVIWNPESEKKISVNNHHMNCDSNIFEGFGVKGIAETVIRNGEIIVKNRKLIDRISNGILLIR